MSVLCIYLYEVFHFMKGLSKSTGTVTVILDLLVQGSLLLQYGSPTDHNTKYNTYLLKLRTGS